MSNMALVDIDFTQPTLLLPLISSHPPNERFYISVENAIFFIRSESYLPFREAVTTLDRTYPGLYLKYFFKYFN